MGNRRKLRDFKLGKRSNKFREKKNPKVDQKGLMQVAGRLFSPDERDEAYRNFATADEMTAAGIPEDEQKKITTFWESNIAPASYEPIIKVVPAKHSGVTVGDCYIHDDGQVSLVLDPNAPKESLDAIKAQARFVGYNLETGTPDGPA